MKLPTIRESLIMVCSLVAWIAVTATFVGLRPEHTLIAAALLALFLIAGPTRKFVVAMLPFIVFGISYDWMNIVHNYEVNPVDISGIYETEKSLFGIAAGGELLTPRP